MSSEILTWRPLPLPSLSGMPMLLVSAEVGNASYTVRVTDMANMWMESLDRRAICMRGFKENTSIDPSDTPENMAKFLDSLEAALNSSQPGHEDTDLSLSPATADDAGRDGLTINVTCALPGFEPLRWPFHLKKLPSSSIATALVLPLVQAHFARKRQVESLTEVLGHKDAVIAKLLDKLEAMGTGLEHTFTALSGRKKVTRSVAEDKVKGLAAFDGRKWRAELDDEMESPESTGDLLRSVFGASGLEYGAMMDIDNSPGLDGWWRDFPGTSRLAHRKRAQGTPPRNVESSTPAYSTKPGDDDDDFQVQATPPHLRSGGKRKATSDAPPPEPASSIDGEGRGDSANLESNASAAVSKTKRIPEPKTANPRLGVIGGGKQPTAFPSSAPEAKSPAKSKSQVCDDSETASEASDDDATASMPGSSPPPAPKPAPAPVARTTGLGRIGGGAQKASLPTDQEEKVKPEPTAPRKLGMIGNKVGGLSSTKPAQESPGRGRAARNQEAAASEPRETSRERADRRREELKRDLEKKAAVGPAKKKRRF